MGMCCDSTLLIDSGCSSIRNFLGVSCVELSRTCFQGNMNRTALSVLFWSSAAKVRITTKLFLFSDLDLIYRTKKQTLKCYWKRLGLQCQIQGKILMKILGESFVVLILFPAWKYSPVLLYSIAFRLCIFPPFPFLSWSPAGTKKRVFVSSRLKPEETCWQFLRLK